ncbi:MAG: hypothetical protein Ct9H300mP14_04670 [Gammaproteobacteria bacterium]|nr:MAG: hypothetical protein Ct9H300mP14_04670 [Gammaproteobacteria bacterium]
MTILAWSTALRGACRRQHQNVCRGIVFIGPASPCQVDSDALIALDVDGLEVVLRPMTTTPCLVWRSGRYCLIVLGGYSPSHRPPACADLLTGYWTIWVNSVTAEHLLAVVLDHLNPIWPRDA